MFVLAGLASTAILGRWVYEARHPARLEISGDRIVAKRRGRAKETILQRTTGELAFGMQTVLGGAHPAAAPVLGIPESDQEPVGVTGYDMSKIRQACHALGWRFVD